MSLNSDPKPEDRQYVRHERTGDLGWLVKRDGKECVKYDRGDAYDFSVPVKRDGKGKLLDWVPEGAPAPLTHFQVAMVAYAADTALDRFLGNQGRRKTWLEMGENERIEWAEKGPKGSGPTGKHRQKLFQAVTKSLKGLTE